MANGFITLISFIVEIFLIHSPKFEYIVSEVELAPCSLADTELYVSQLGVLA